VIVWHIGIPFSSGSMLSTTVPQVGRCVVYFNISLGMIAMLLLSCPSQILVRSFLW